METIKLDDLQLNIMQVLWWEGESSVQEIKLALYNRFERNLAIQTISTVLQRLFDKGIVDYYKDGRKYIHLAVVSEKEAQDSMLKALIEQLFAGKADSLMSHLLEFEMLTRPELETLHKAIEKRRQNSEGTS